MDGFAIARAIGAIIFATIAGAAGYYIGAPYHMAIESMFAMGLAVGAATALFGLLPLDYIASLLFGFAFMFLPWTASYLLGMFIAASSGLAMLGNMVAHFYLDTEKEKLRSL